MQADWTARLDRIDWKPVSAELDAVGGAVIPGVLSAAECDEMVALFEDHPERFRKTVHMERHRFGAGEYRYLDKPYPLMIETLREAFYTRLREVAVDWWTKLRKEPSWPESFAEWQERCQLAGQRESSVILLRYQAGGWNALHRDLYGELVFPMQVVINLSRPGTDFDGGEFMLVENRMRAQSRATVFRMNQGDGCIFTTRDRPILGSSGRWSAAGVRHGVSVVTSGRRYTLGLLLHEAT